MIQWDQQMVRCRIGDLFVNMNIIKAEVERHDNADKNDTSIMSQVSSSQ